MDRNSREHVRARTVQWRFGAASVSIGFDPNGRAMEFSAMLLQKGPTRVSVSSDHALGITTLDEIRNYGSPVHEVEYGEDCSYESYGYRDTRSTAAGMGDRFIRFVSRECPFVPEESWYPVIGLVTIDGHSF